ncbi:hypothetical protein L1987_60245 [Smallanthus sonchifolius]|uniref:Uncharacterized protein n=1 Tax=Smallanthus sonchifolius TaxID=185202 RepID=A0ACB9D7K3_9ASTR|nr:hypothetical protein L1987_60245 [Smallanthus sonchifolius]
MSLWTTKPLSSINTVFAITGGRRTFTAALLYSTQTPPFSVAGEVVQAKPPSCLHLDWPPLPSSSSRTTVDNADEDNDDTVDGQNGEDENVNANIMFEDEPSQVTLKTKLTKEMEEELYRQAIAEILRQGELEAKAQADADIVKAAAESLSSILSKKLEEEKKSASERMNIPIKYARVYLRRKVTKDVQSEPLLVIIPEGSPKVQKSTKDVSKETTHKVVQEPVIPKSTPRKKSIQKRVLRKGMDVIIPSKDKYKRLYESEHVDDLSDIDLERMLKNMRNETLKKLVNDMKSVEKNQALREKLAELEKSKKRRLEIGSRNYDTQKNLFEARLRELDDTKLKPNVNVEEVSKEIYSSYAAEAPIKVSVESKATWFKKKHESSSRVVDSFEKDSYVDEMYELVVEREDNMEPLRMYELAQIRTLTNEDIFALAAMDIAYKHEHEFYARDFANLLTKVSMDMRGIDYDNSQTFVLDHQLGGRL